MKYILLNLLMIVVTSAFAQTTITNRSDLKLTLNNGYYLHDHESHVHHVQPPTTEAIEQLLREDSLDWGSKTYRFATATETDVDFIESAKWITRGAMTYGRLLLVARAAKSISLNFNRFYIPASCEVVMYNSKRKLVGPVKSNENNEGRTWGSPILAGDSIWIEAQLLAKDKGELQLQISNLAYGYRDFDMGKSGGFGVSGSCLANNNVVCFGNGWEFERNAVCLIIDASGQRFCTGSMINNSCNNNVPYVLSANHCLWTTPNINNCRFVFQYWSPSCNPSQDDPNYIQFSGCTMRSSAGSSDFMLLQLNQMPDPGAGITYLGWDRTVNAATNGASIHHPLGDVMKISTFSSAAQRIDNYVFADGKKAIGSQHWIVSWNNGITEDGSSGAPLLNQSKKIVGQLSGGSSACNAPANYQKDAFGRFDNSWTGGGTNSSRLSNWLDPANFGNTTTSSIVMSYITGSNVVCTTAAYSVANLQAGTSVVAWASSNTSLLTINSAGTASRVGNANGQVTLTATLNNGCGNFTRTRTVHVGKPIVNGIIVDSDVCPGQGQDIVANVLGASTTTWSVTSGNAFNATLMDNGNGIAYFNSNVQDCYGLQINAANACGSVLDGTTVCVISCFGNIIAYPNPAKDAVTLDFSAFVGKDLPDEIQIFHEKSTAMKRSIAVRPDSDQKLQIDTHDWPRGTYYFHIVRKSSPQTEKIRILLE